MKPFGHNTRVLQTTDRRHLMTIATKNSKALSRLSSKRTTHNHWSYFWNQTDLPRLSQSTWISCWSFFCDWDSFRIIYHTDLHYSR